MAAVSDKLAAASLDPRALAELDALVADSQLYFPMAITVSAALAEAGAAVASVRQQAGRQAGVD